MLNNCEYLVSSESGITKSTSCVSCLHSESDEYIPIPIPAKNALPFVSVSNIFGILIITELTSAKILLHKLLLAPPPPVSYTHLDHTKE